MLYFLLLSLLDFPLSTEVEEDYEAMMRCYFNHTSMTCGKLWVCLGKGMFGLLQTPGDQ